MTDPWDHISPCGLYRYELGIPISRDDRRALFLLHNPSTATKNKPDPTSTRVIGFGRQLEVGTVVIANPMAYRSTYKRDLLRVTDPVGPKNLEIVRALAEKSDVVIVGWGKVHKRLAHHVSRMRRALEGIQLYALRVNDDGSPEHPLYLPRDLRPVRWPCSL